MALLVVDASVAVKWISLEDLSDHASLLLGPGLDLIAPDIVTVEVSVVLSRKVREGHMRRDDALRICGDIGDFFVQLVEFAPLQRPALQLSLDVSHPFLDCLYLQLAIARDCQFVTADRKFVAKLAGTPHAGRAVHLADWIV